MILPRASDIYTTFTFLSGSGWANGKVGPTYYICYGSLVFILSYWLQVTRRPTI
jgi:SSS family solute:Na+ symporter